MLTLNISKTKQNGSVIHIAKISGNANQSNVVLIDKEIKRLIREGRGNFDLIINAENLEFANHSLLKDMVGWMQALKAKNHQLLLINLHKNLNQVFKQIPHFDNLNEAEASLT